MDEINGNLNNKINSAFNTYPLVNPFSKTITCKLDSGATNSYIRFNDVGILNNIKKDTSGRIVILPDNNNMKIKQVGELNTPKEIGAVGKKQVLYLD